MKKSIAALMIIPVLFCAGCSKKQSILFCEGMSPDGKGINCGTKFETGELTALITADSPFDANKVEIVILEEDGKDEPIERITVEVQPEGKKTSASLSFYRGGIFTVRAVRGEDTIGEASIEIVDFQ